MLIRPYLLCATGILLAGCGPPPVLVRAVAERNPDVLFHVSTTDSVVALTIDDGPHAMLTPEILDVLAENDARATFFLMGKHIPGNEHLVRRIVEDGHELGNHMMTARPAWTLGPRRFEASLDSAHALLSPFGSVQWFRPASGWFNARMRREACKRGYRTVLGSVYPNDVQNPFAGYLSRYILRHTRPGSIIILHDGSQRRRRTVIVLKRVLPELRRRGYRITTLAELTGQSEKAVVREAHGAHGEHPVGTYPPWQQLILQKPNVWLKHSRNSGMR